MFGLAQAWSDFGGLRIFSNFVRRSGPGTRWRCLKHVNKIHQRWGLPAVSTVPAKTDPVWQAQQRHYALARRKAGK